jgi:hypothetical protein
LIKQGEPGADPGPRGITYHEVDPEVGERITDGRDAPEPGALSVIK